VPRRVGLGRQGVRQRSATLLDGALATYEAAARVRENPTVDCVESSDGRGRWLGRNPAGGEGGRAGSSGRRLLWCRPPPPAEPPWPPGERASAARLLHRRSSAGRHEALLVGLRRCRLRAGHSSRCCTCSARLRMAPALAAAACCCCWVGGGGRQQDSGWHAQATGCSKRLPCWRGCNPAYNETHFPACQHSGCRGSMAWRRPGARTEVSSGPASTGSSALYIFYLLLHRTNPADKTIGPG
jgi:hypothetical protein